MNYYCPELGEEIKKLGYPSWGKAFDFLFDLDISFSSSVTYYKSKDEFKDLVQLRLERKYNVDTITFYVFDEKNTRFELVTLTALGKFFKDYLLRLLKLKAFI